MSYNPSSSYSINGQAIFQGGSRSLTTLYPNASGMTIPILTPVSSNVNGQIAPTDITNEASYLSFVGITYDTIPNGASGRVVSGGRIENVTTSFAVGDPIWIAPGGVLTNIKPDIGTNGFTTGCFILFVGSLVKNQYNPAQTDIQLLFEHTGQF